MGTAPVDPPRQLTPDERTLLRWLLERGTEEARALVAQVEHLRVVSRCDCGCPSIDFGLADGTPGPHAGGIVAEAAGESPEGALVGVMVWAGGAQVATLEVYAMADVERFSLPAPDRLEATNLEVSKRDDG
jgi:hypothetical protein